ncbi:MAG: diguanylate cyclase [Alicyclobacillus sp.]|nr:diguanylate cyclase [Alicyclobacillus sp.]
MLTQWYKEQRDNIPVMLYTAALWSILIGFLVTRHTILSIHDWTVLYTLAGSLLVLDRFSVKVSNEITLYFDTVYVIGFSLAYGSSIVVCAGLLFAIVASLQRPKYWYLKSMNVAIFMLSAVTSTSALHRLLNLPLHNVFSGFGPVFIYGIVYFLTNVTLLTMYYAMRQRAAGIKAMLSAFSVQFVVVYGVEVLIGLLLSLVLEDAGLAGAILFTGLILLVSYSYRDYFKMANHFKELSIRDELTGLYNHRWIQSWMDEHIEQQKPFALLMIDIDHFRRYNEMLGHIEGDEALKRLAQVLQANCGEDCGVARYSGEEFLMVLPEYTLHQAQLKAEMVRKAVESADIADSKRAHGRRITISIGLATFPNMAKTKRDLLMMVDDALYKGKFTGRNKVSIYTSVIDEMQKELDGKTEMDEIVRTIKVFLSMLNTKDRYTYAHTERDVLYAEALAKKIGMNPTELQYLRFGALLHDIGKVEVPIEVLTKRGPLIREEWAIMQKHVEMGVNIVKPIRSLAPCLPIIRHHHERWDGTGYPDGLSGTEIPLAARILTIADSFDAMTTSRPYQRKRSMEEAFVELRACAGRHFDPALVEPFIEVVKEIGLLSPETDEEDLA